MNNHNYCLIKENKIYQDLYEILENEELIMDNPNNNVLIQYHIKKLAETYINNNKITISNTFSSTDEILEDLIIEINEKTNQLDDNDVQGNTLLIFANNDYMYEIIFMEKIGVEIRDTKLNQFGTISNIELAPIYGSLAIVKSSYSNGNLKNTTINKTDILELCVYVFYHKGVMINPNDSILDLEFAGDNPCIVIGTNFKQLPPLQIFGLHVVGYNEVGTEINNTATELFEKEIKGRFFITLLCPITNKKFWNIDIEIVKNLIKLLKYVNGTTEQKELINKLNNELNNDKLINPFFLIKKYSMYNL
jgi:hypothetical protein